MKRALLVGINAYKSSPLNGCVNDVKLMYQVLDEVYKFEQIEILTDGRATKARIIKWLKWLVRDVEPGDQIYFHYSGHGSQVVVDDRSLNSEADGVDEIICNYDLDWDDPIRDHHLGSMLKLVPEGVKVTITLDCCHSGTGLRNPAACEHPTRNRFLPPPISNTVKEKDFRFDLESLKRVRKTQPRNGGKHERQHPFLIDTVEQGDAVLISGCQENQTSADAWIQGRYQGALTYYLAHTLMNNDWNISHRKLVDRINQELDSAEYTQNPQLEGKKKFWNDLFLGGV